MRFWRQRPHLVRSVFGLSTGGMFLLVLILILNLTIQFFRQSGQAPDSNQGFLVRSRFAPNSQLNQGKVYIVQAGDTLFAIARNFGVSVTEISLANGLLNPNIIHIGQNLVIPGIEDDPPQPEATLPPAPTPETGDTLPETATAVPEDAVYTIRRGDSLYLIARQYNSSITAILAANQIANPNLIYAGQVIMIPITVEGGNADTIPTNPPLILPTPAATAVNASPPTELIWPNEYRGIYQRFNYRHAAVDIAMPIGTAVMAAGDGVVEFAGWHAAGFGYLIIINHQNGSRTIYAHNKELQVVAGQAVRQGESIALSGSSGFSTHPHLHFGITENLRQIDPCHRLAGGC